MKIKKIFIFVFIGLFLASCSATNYLTLKEIKESGKLIVTTNAEFAPFEYKEKGKFKGIDIEIIENYAKYIDVDLQIIDTDFDAALLSVSTFKSDLAIAAITKNPARETKLSFTKSYYKANQVVIVRKDSVYSDLKTREEVLEELSQNNAIIGCQRGTTGQYFIEGDDAWGYKKISNTECRKFDNGAMAVNSLANGQIDAVIIDEVPAIMYCSKVSNVVCLDMILTEEEYAIAVAKGNESLLSSLNDFIDLIKENGVFEEIIGEYYGK